MCTSYTPYLPEIHENLSFKSGHSKIDKTKGLKTDGSLLKVESIAECSKGSILQYFPPSLSYRLSLRSLFLSIFEWLLKTGFTVFGHTAQVSRVQAEVLDCRKCLELKLCYKYSRTSMARTRPDRRCKFDPSMFSSDT